jgi:hypothetical protein
MNKIMRFVPPLLILTLCSLSLEEAKGQATAKSGKDRNPVELGAVHWLRGFDNAFEVAKKEDKPLLVLFQEVPG